MKKLMFVCTGNTCRSPMACEMFKKFIGNEKKFDLVRCDSAGISAATGEKASPNAIKVMNEIGIDLTSHKAKNIFDLNVGDIDLFAVMNLVHYEILKTMGILPEKIYVLTGKVEDPYGGSEDVYRTCRERIQKSLKPLFAHVNKIIKQKSTQ